MNKFNREDYKDEKVLEIVYHAIRRSVNGYPETKISIFEDWLSGYTYSKLGKTYNKTPTRISQVIQSLCHRYDWWKENMTELDSTAVEKQNFSVRTYNAIRRRGIDDLKQLSDMTQKEFLETRNLGVKSAEEVYEAMKLHNIQFKEEEPEPVEEEYTQERFCDKPVDIKTYVKNHTTPPPTTLWEENYCVTKTEWEYSCPVYKVLEEMILTLQEQMDNANIIKRDVYDNTLPSVDMFILIGDIGETLQHYRDKIKQIPVITVSYDTTMEHKDEMINTLRDVEQVQHEHKVLHDRKHRIDNYVVNLYIGIYNGRHLYISPSSSSSFIQAR